MIASLVVVISFSFDQGLLRPEGTTSTCARVQAATGWRRGQTAPRLRLMFPEVHTHFESPRQEEHHSTPAEMRNSRTIQRSRSHPLAARIRDSHECRLLTSTNRLTE